ncbi:unnamed protein product [Amoebophrya sp. A25]|nr:unnamed protein product [Amoebophrya sp. A25]|eukprot:GSA25T00015378001.1
MVGKRELQHSASSTSHQDWKLRRADAAIAWVEGLLAEFGCETRRLPRRSQGTLLVRAQEPSNDAVKNDDTARVDEEDDEKPLWRALQVRCNTYEGKTRTVLASQKRMSTDIGMVVVNHLEEQARVLHLGSVKLRKARSGPRVLHCFSLPYLRCIRGTEGRSELLRELQEVLGLLRPRSRSEWLAELPGSVATKRWQGLCKQLAEKVIVPAGFADEPCAQFFNNTYDFTIEGRKCVLRWSTMVPNFRNYPRISFKRTRMVNGRSVLIPLGNVEDFDFLFALLSTADGVLAGLFVFPRCYLVKWAVCAQNFAGGQTGMTLYPPVEHDVVAPVRSKRQQADEQREFFIDLKWLQSVYSTDILLSQNDKDTTASSAALAKFRKIILANYDVKNVRHDHERDKPKGNNIH